jgi:hypothetical protein
MDKLGEWPPLLAEAPEQQQIQFILIETPRHEFILGIHLGVVHSVISGFHEENLLTCEVAELP